MNGVSIIVATYNGAQFIRDQLSSLITQTEPAAEIIVCDDGSTDETVAIAEATLALGSTPYRIVVNSPNKGVARNFREAICDTGQRYVAFCDQDDIWYPEKLSLCKRQLQRTGAALVAHSVDLIDQRGQKLGRWGQGIQMRNNRIFRIDPWANFLGMSTVFDKDRISRINLDYASAAMSPHDRQGLSHDQLIDFLCDAMASQTGITQPLAAYRLHETNLSKVSTRLARRSVQLKVAAGLTATPSRRLSQVASSRSIVLAALAHDRPDIAGILSEGERKWGDLASIERRREALYASPTTLSRLRYYTALLRGGEYRSWQAGGAGWGAAFKDLALGVSGIARSKSSFADDRSLA